MTYTLSQHCFFSAYSVSELPPEFSNKTERKPFPHRPTHKYFLFKFGENAVPFGPIFD